MATSGSTTFTSTESEIITDAYLTLNVHGSEESIPAADYSLAKRYLNRLVQNWQSQGLHLWTKETATIFLQKGQRTYELSSTGDHATLDYEKTTLSTDYAIGTSTFVFDTAISANVDDFIGIELDDNSLYWSTVQTVVNPTSVTIAGSLPSAASENNIVYTYTTRLDEPFNVMSGLRSNQSETDLQMTYFSYQEYFTLNNKSALGNPISYNYDRQLGKGIISVWPVPENVEYLMKIVMTRKLENFVTNANTPDFPQEWHEALVNNLAVKLALPFGKTGGQKFQDLKAIAKESLDAALTFNSEEGSIFLQPDMTGRMMR